MLRLDDNVKTKIVATLGPASESADVLEQLVRAGADVFRLNFAHGSWAWHDGVVQRIRDVSRKLGKPLAILQDLAGPKLRLGDLPGGVVICARGDRLSFVRESTGQSGELTASYAGLVDDLRKGDHVLLADGGVSLQVIGKHPGRAELEVIVAGEIRSRQGIHVPGGRLQLEPLTDKDIHDMDWTASHEVDFAGISFVRRPEDIDRARQELQRRGCQAQIVAKIERAEALESLDAILRRTDAVMVARGDLGIDIDIARVPLVQKQIIQQCHRVGVPVITATQMLESMRTSNRPTRAEASDVANAILDGTDAVMLSGETANGQYPVEAVETMNRIARETEQSLPAVLRAMGRELEQVELEASKHADITQAAVEAAGRMADRLKARLVVVATDGGHTALALSKQRYLTPTLGLSDQPATVRRMALYWGVIPVLFEEPRVPADYVGRVTDWVRQQGLVSTGDRILFVFGSHWADSTYNTVLVHEVR